MKYIDGLIREILFVKVLLLYLHRAKHKRLKRSLVFIFCGVTTTIDLTVFVCEN